MLRQPMLSLIVVWIVLTITWFGLVTRGGKHEFSPQTLEVRNYRQMLLLERFPIYESPYEYSTPASLRFLIDEGYVTPDTNKKSKWIMLHHWYADLIFASPSLMLMDEERVTIWSQANPARARHCWPKLFALLRSKDARDRELGWMLVNNLDQIYTIDQFEARLQSP